MESERAGPGLRRGRRRRKLTPEDYLEKAMRAKTPRARGGWARRGLAATAELDTTTQAMLLRQLYLCDYAEERFESAYTVAQQAAELDVLADVMHQDAARALQATGDTAGAIGHLRLAARLGPTSRRAFHWWTLGSALFLAERHDEAIAALTRAARWGTTEKPLYQGHLALAKCRAGKKVRGLRSLMDRLDSCPAGQGYGRFVLGQLAYEGARFGEARTYLETFVRRHSGGRRAMEIALAGELQMARDTLAALDRAG
jgi:tetratricopeptide (TPR) repeat protein